jgi:hypothetical protein
MARSNVKVTCIEIELEARCNQGILQSYYLHVIYLHTCIVKDLLVINLGIIWIGFMNDIHYKYVRNIAVICWPFALIYIFVYESCSTASVCPPLSRFHQGELHYSSRISDVITSYVFFINCVSKLVLNPSIVMFIFYHDN